MTTANASKLRGSFTAGRAQRLPRSRATSPRCRNALRETGRKVMLVPTMGALHEGHLALVRAAKRTRRGRGGVDLRQPVAVRCERGSRRVPADPRRRSRAAAGGGRRDRVRPDGAPTCTRTGRRTSVQPGPLGAELEGASRPTHFAGMLTVVLKLLQIVRPDRAFFGEKDYQQLVLIRQMVADLNVDARIVGVPDRAGSRRAGHVVAQPLSRRGATGAGGDAVGRAAGGRCTPRPAAPTRRWTPRVRCSTRCPRSTSTTSRCATPTSGPAPAEGTARTADRGPARQHPTARQHRDRHRGDRRHRRATTAGVRRRSTNCLGRN